MSPLDESLLQIIAKTADTTGEVRQVAVSFRGSSAWLEDCRRLVSALPFVRESTGDVVVTDEPEGAGWRFALNGRRLSPDLREFFWHAAAGPQAVELALCSEAGVECEARVPAYAGFHWRRDHAAAIAMAPALLGLALANRAGYRLGLETRRTEIDPPERAPGVFDTTIYKARKLARSLLVRTVGKPRPLAWRIALHEHAAHGLPATGWRWFRGFPEHQEADPFLARDGEACWLFYEDMLPPSLHGRLAVAPAFAQGGEPRVILEAGHHLSYPCVFPHGGAWWMIPESEANRTVELYRATSFPYEWERAATLLAGPALVDTTPLEHEGRWYFFTTAIAPGRGLVSLLFHSDALAGDWKLHPASPISLDAALSRGAGPIRKTGGRLIRPVQDCLEAYGYAMTLREIEELTPTTFRERTVTKILPDWQKGLRATHTIVREGEALVLDALREEQDQAKRFIR